MVKKGNLGEDEILNRLSDIVCILSEEEKNVLRKNLFIQHYKKNEVIYSEGDVPTHMLCLISGKVKIFKDGISGRTQIIRVICKIPIELIYQWMSTNNKLAMFFIKLLAIDLGISDQRTVNLTQKHIRGRLAEALLFLKDSYGLEEDGATLSIYLSREDLANLSNMTTSNAIRTLSTFASEKLIAIDGRKIKVIDEERLRKISRIG